MLRVAALGELGKDEQAFGAKALHLARLKRQGLPVPDGFVIAWGADPVPGIDPPSGGTS